MQYIALFAIAVALRFAYLAFCAGPSPADTDAYLSIANNLLAGKGFALATGT